MVVRKGLSSSLRLALCKKHRYTEGLQILLECVFE